MSFDKVKAMRNAERFLSQGKIRAAIGEYKRVVENDPKDFGTLNILGDLYLKNSEEKEAVNCFTQVAEHYNTQGFSQKAIAVYGKIARLQPNSLEISAKLAELYKSKGSFAEARSHFKIVAEEYQRKGQKLEALEVWKQIAELDPNDTAIFLKIADIYWQEGEREEAAKAFCEAGARLFKHKNYEAALAAYNNALEINRFDLVSLKGYVDAQIKLECADEAAAKLEEVLAEQPYNREVLFLLIDSYIDSGNPQQAEQAIIKLVEHEPANYPKFLDLIEIYLREGDLDSAARLLSMSSEHLLVGGQSEQFLHWTNEILARNPEHLDALRLAVRYFGWNRDEAQLKQALENLSEAARQNGAVEDEHHALSQLIMIAPHASAYAQRLQELKAEYGFEEMPVTYGEELKSEIPIFDTFNPENDGAAAAYAGEGKIYEGDFGSLNGDFNFAGGNGGGSNEEHGFAFVGQETIGNENGSGEFAFANNDFADYIVDGVVSENQPIDAGGEPVAEFLSAGDELRLEQEIESVEFYISQGYYELAEKTLAELESKFGNRPEFAAIRMKLGSALPSVAANDNGNSNGNGNGKSRGLAEMSLATELTGNGNNGGAEFSTNGAKSFDFLNEFKDELGFEEFETKGEDQGDYDTHYHLATAYREMGLLEDAIREFQDAINLVKSNDGTRRFFQCCNLLGLCFMEKAMPNLALMWYRRGFETPDLNAEEQQALHYEIANAYATGGDAEKAVEYFEKIYAENVDYRDVSRRLESLKENQHLPA